MSVWVDLLAALTWPAAVVYAAWRLAAVAERFVPRPVRDTTSADLSELEDHRIPEDLAALASQYPDAWAQEDIMQVIRERYAEHKDWDLVRRAVGVALPMDSR